MKIPADVSMRRHDSNDARCDEWDVTIHVTGDPVVARKMALPFLVNLPQQQSSALAYFDRFLAFGVLAAAFTFPVLLMQRSVAEKGAHVAAE